MISFSFKEWMLQEGMPRRALMTHEEIPEFTPSPSHTVLWFHNPESAKLTNDNIYGVINKDDENIHLIKFRDVINPKKAIIRQSNLDTVSVPRRHWNEFQMVQDLLTTKEKRSDWGRHVVWGFGPGLERWRKNRQRPAMSVADPSATQPSASQVAMARQSLMSQPSGSADDTAVQKARASLLGGEQPAQRDKSPEELAQKLKMQWRLGR